MLTTPLKALMAMACMAVSTTTVHAQGFFSPLPWGRTWSPCAGPNCPATYGYAPLLADGYNRGYGDQWAPPPRYQPYGNEWGAGYGRRVTGGGCANGSCEKECCNGNCGANPQGAPWSPQSWGYRTTGERPSYDPWATRYPSERIEPPISLRRVRPANFEDDWSATPRLRAPRTYDSANGPFYP